MRIAEPEKEGAKNMNGGILYQHLTFKTFTPNRTLASKRHELEPGNRNARPARSRVCMSREMANTRLHGMLLLISAVASVPKVEEEQSQQRELALEKEKMAAAFDNLKNLVEEDADTETEYVKVGYHSLLSGTGP